MEKFGLFDLIDKLSSSLTTKSAAPQPTQNPALNPKNNNKTKGQTAKNSARLFLLRHEELSRKIDSGAKK